MARGEFGQNTLRRALSADPRRLRLVLRSWPCSSLAVVAVTVIPIVGGTLIFQSGRLGACHLVEIGTGEDSRRLAGRRHCLER